MKSYNKGESRTIKHKQRLAVRVEEGEDDAASSAITAAAAAAAAASRHLEVKRAARTGCLKRKIKILKIILHEVCHEEQVGKQIQMMEIETGCLPLTWPGDTLTLRMYLCLEQIHRSTIDED